MHVSCQLNTRRTNRHTRCQQGNNRQPPPGYTPPRQPGQFLPPPHQYRWQLSRDSGRGRGIAKAIEKRCSILAKQDCSCQIRIKLNCPQQFRLSFVQSVKIAGSGIASCNQQEIGGILRSFRVPVAPGNQLEHRQGRQGYDRYRQILCHIHRQCRCTCSAKPATFITTSLPGGQAIVPLACSTPPNKRINACKLARFLSDPHERL